MQNIMHLRWFECHVPRPVAEPTRRVDGLNPLIQSFTLGLVLLTVSSLDLQRQRLPVRQPDDEVGNVTATRSLPEVVDLEA